MDKWNFILTVIISILCGVVANMGTPTIMKLFTKGISGYRSAQLIAYKTRLESILSHRNNYSVVILLLLQDIISAGMLVIVSILLLEWSYLRDINFLKNVWLMPMSAALGVLASSFGYVRLILYPKYTDKLSRKIERLEAKVSAKNKDKTQAVSN